ncbi:MAG TPA: hypothetical protein VE913_25005 [Longimicrobium sp.]|nr:hypothetical protein [Longimicrobium sp.]
MTTFAPLGGLAVAALLALGVAGAGCATVQRDGPTDAELLAEIEGSEAGVIIRNSRVGIGTYTIHLTEGTGVEEPLGLVGTGETVLIRIPEPASSRAVRLIARSPSAPEVASDAIQFTGGQGVVSWDLRTNQVRRLRQ